MLQNLQFRPRQSIWSAPWNRSNFEVTAARPYPNHTWVTLQGIIRIHHKLNDQTSFWGEFNEEFLNKGMNALQIFFLFLELWNANFAPLHALWAFTSDFNFPAIYGTGWRLKK